MTLTLTPLDRLQRRLAAAYAMTASDEQTLAGSIMGERVYAWQKRLAELARAVGSYRPGQGPNGEDRAVLWQMSMDDAKSIVATYNAELAREIERLYAAQPDGSREYYVNALESWSGGRAQWKDRQIALMNEKTARFYAQERFREMNRARSQYRFSGPAPVCDDCAENLAAGVVDQAHVDANPTPLHPNCPHEWTMTRLKLGVPVRDLWTG